eukprot:Nitzschia sp. Nitz4//scaffold901_size694//338//676//NITZ4_009336-RA/size694-processed-gene-0.0-mRNA-1//-1//CDS//3329559969//2814//frame0
MERQRRLVFDAIIERRYGVGLTNGSQRAADTDNDFIEYEDAIEQPRRLADFEEMVDHSGHAFNQNPTWDRLLNSEIMIPGMPLGTVARRATDMNGKTLGTYNDNPFMNSMTY